MNHAAPHQATQQRWTAAAIAYQGRTVQLLNSWLVFATIVGLSAIVIGGAVAAGGFAQAGRLLALALGAIAGQSVCILLRWRAKLRARPKECVRQASEGPLPQTPELVIACSGGGIKSASFCLGALQRLRAAGLYQRSDTVVGVSGGGYVAAAFAALRVHRTRQSGQANGVPGADGVELFAPQSPELQALRSRVDYLLASTRVRFNLGASVVTGVAIHVLILAAIAHLVAWICVEHTAITQSPQRFDWTVPSVWLPPAVLMGLAMPVFVYGRGVEPARRLRRRTGPLGDLVPAGRRGYTVAWYVSSLPGFLVYGAVAHVVLLSVVPWLAISARWHWWGGGLDGSAAWAAASAGFVAALGTAQAFVTSTVKGVRTLTEGGAPAGAASVPRPEPWWTPVLVRFRRQAAPLLGLLLVALAMLAYVAFMVGVGLTARPASDVPPLSALKRWPDVLASPLPALLVLLILRWVHPAQATSLVPFYEDRLSFAYLEIGLSADRPTGHSLGKDEFAPLTLADIAPRQTSRGPHLRLCATANVRDAHLLPAGRHGTPFVFGDDGIGLTDGNLPGGQSLVKPARYGRVNGKNGGGPPTWKAENVTLARAVAVSAAAISPLAGRENRLIGAARILLALANIRLGVWVRNPYWVEADSAPHGGGEHPIGRVFDRAVDRANHLLDRSSPLHVVHEALGVPSVYAPYLYLTDGGHYDNLGLVEALRLRPRCVVLLDGSGDQLDTFSAMSQAMSSARMDLGVEVGFDPTDLRVGDEAAAAAPMVRITARYDDGSTTQIVYVKSVWTDLPPWDVRCYRLRHPDFPTVSNELETYDEFDFEAYRELGWCYAGAAVPSVEACLDGATAGVTPTSTPGGAQASS